MIISKPSTNGNPAEALSWWTPNQRRRGASRGHSCAWGAPRKSSFLSRSLTNGWDLIGIYRDYWGFYGDYWGFYGDYWGFDGDYWYFTPYLLGFFGIYMGFIWDHLGVVHAVNQISRIPYPNVAASNPHFFS